jgi:hypothetical protein
MFSPLKMRGFYRAVVVLSVVFCAAPVSGSGKREAPASTEKVVVASTSWVAAIARAAGAENVRVLAPADLRHPPEYELKPSDLRAAADAGLILYAGWEMFAERLVETAGSAGVEVMIVNTSNDPEILYAEAGKIAALLGTEAGYEAWRQKFSVTIEELRGQIAAAYPDRRAVVQRMQSPFARWAGFEIIGEYGPAEPSPALIFDLAKTSPAVVIDNYHGPAGQPVAEAARAPYAELINFPGKSGTVTIEDVFRYNTTVLLQAAPR